MLCRITNSTGPVTRDLWVFPLIMVRTLGSNTRVFVINIPRTVHVLSCQNKTEGLILWAPKKGGKRTRPGLSYFVVWFRLLCLFCHTDTPKLFCTCALFTFALDEAKILWSQIFFTTTLCGQFQHPGFEENFHRLLAEKFHCCRVIFAGSCPAQKSSPERRNNFESVDSPVLLVKCGNGQ